MRRRLLLLPALLVAWTVIPLAHAYAQGGGGGGDDDTSKKKRDSEWNLRQAPLPGQKNAGPCPYVKVLYDAARYEEFKDGQEASNSVGYTGEIEGVAAQCAYRTTDPIKVNMRLTFELGRGPQATESKKTYTYWVAVTHRNRAVLAKEYFTLPVSFPAGKDRVTLTDDVNGIVIPRADATVAGDNFEILVGFDVTPQMADFNREGKRFRINAGAAAAGGGGASGGR